MFHKLLVALHVIAFVSTLSGQASFGSAELIDQGWQFNFGDAPGAQAFEYDSRQWQKITIPHDWSIHQRMDPALASCTGYLPGGIGWYRKTLTLPRMGGEKVFIHFDGVYNRSEVYLNGHLLGKRPNGYISFYYDVTPFVKFDQENILAVRVDHSRSADSRWYTGSGIYRNVYVIRSGAVHLAPWGLFARTSEGEGKVDGLKVTAEIQNESALEQTILIQHRLLSHDGHLVKAVEASVVAPAGGVVRADSVIASHELTLWSLEAPYRYTLETTVFEGERVVDTTTTLVGARSLRFDSDKGFFLNGLSTKLKGVCLHHDAGALGAAVPKLVWEKRLRTLKSLGCNAIRMSHNPQAPEVYDLCDELGLLVLDEAFDEWEFPKRKWIKGWNVGEPGFEGITDFFAEWSDRDIADMVRRNRNHPSIFAWSIGNEIDYPNDPYSHPVLDKARIDQPMLPGYKTEQPDANRLGDIAMRLAAAVRKHDDSRPVTAALAGVVMSNATEYPAALDIVGYNYTESRYQSDHEQYPNRVIYGSETRHNIEAWRSVVENEYISGQFLWTGIDYLGEAGAWPSRGSSAGLLDLTGAVKPRGRYREALWSEKPVIYLGTDVVRKEGNRATEALPFWNYRVGEMLRVYCYTNAASVQLSLNGKFVGEALSANPKEGVLSWDLPFEEGRLEAVAQNAQGVEVGRTVLRSAGAPASWALHCEERNLSPRRGLAMISLQLVDAMGVPVFLADREVTCAVSGPGRLLALEAGNNKDVSDYSDATQSSHHGRLIAYVESTGGAGSVSVQFTSQGLPSASIALPISE